jgi:hypothetical protein
LRGFYFNIDRFGGEGPRFGVLAIGQSKNPFVKESESRPWDAGAQRRCSPCPIGNNPSKVKE